ncbi:MAG: beta-ketoacyl-ACP synthase II [Chlamydiales bacterium]|nr:beta-ketoacyl-ACP synthase II [Chlamydiia bacterium]MCP5508394.1 beta-ketoacyl-ACP synthase II [Chlamydiales bacterium]
MSKKRIVVTGLGLVSCFGNDVETFYNNLLAGKSGVETITDFPTDELSTKFAAKIKDFSSEGYIDKKQARRIDQCIAYCIVAGKRAMEDAKLTGDALERLDKARCGIVIGSGMGGMQKFAEGVITMHEKGCSRVTPFFIPFVLTNMPGGMLAMDIGFMGPNYSISTACATGNNSIIAAANHIRNGEADLMITGGVEHPIVPMGVAGFCACKALSQRNDAPQKASRPWDRDRDGFVMGEGSGVIVLESLEHALARGATIYAEYLGGGITCDAHHMTEPHPEGKGVELCLRAALRDAEVAAENVNYVNAHATSTPLGDMAEINAIKRVLPDPSKVVMNATKSMIGHCLGAAGGIEAVVTVMGIKTGKVHPTINLENPEPNLGFITPTKAQDLDIKVAISNSFGFGGHNATVVFAPYR